ncbi:hypothetical protein FVO59_06815 [Microbacterium esteraromaticum]|uniref:Uncharacterized protein n=1 Tax=Microbacterium esteraromaticum TaxID=57043 RepID=A0A7D8AJ86_9MICO|nr:hypothetical protein [Microbacterium esteraromaticum]QMU96966.1 hypothetical protein FVO59_06815 [Microbacterium esteraromaticum]
MHTFSGDAMGHGTNPDHAMSAAAGTAATVHHADDHREARSAEAWSAEAPVADAPGPPAHAAMAMTCVLALLAALMLVVRPSASVIIGRSLQRMPCGRASASRAAPARPPSHIALCISRT